MVYIVYEEINTKHFARGFTASLIYAALSGLGDRRLRV
jgi:hypothetical protein